MSIIQYAPIILFVYNRPDHTRRTVEALQKNIGAAESDLFIFSDGPRPGSEERVQQVRAYIKTISGFKSVTLTEREKNLGLANSVLSGVAEVIEKNGRVIVLEDDLITAPHFLTFMNEALNRYEEDERIFSIGGYSPCFEMPRSYKIQTYLTYRCCSWGWATWKDRWCSVDWAVADFMDFLRSEEKQRLFDQGGDDLSRLLIMQMEGRIDSWAIRWDYAHHKHEAYCLRPYLSLVRNIGFDGSGVHCGDGKPWHYRDFRISEEMIRFDENISFDQAVNDAFKAAFLMLSLTGHKTGTGLRYHFQVMFKKVKNYLAQLKNEVTAVP